MTMDAFLFWVIAGLTGACAIATVVTHNIVRAATWLLFTLAGTSGLFFLIGADLVGAVQLLVYVGGTMVLVVFGVMLTAQGPFITMRTSSAEWAVSAATGLAMLAVLILAISKAPTFPPRADSDVGMTAKSSQTMLIGQGFSGVGVGPAHKDPNSTPTAMIRTNYLLPFEIVSVHLLVVLIGAAYLARAKRRRGVAK